MPQPCVAPRGPKPPVAPAAVAAALALLVFAVFWQVRRHGFVALDDEQYVSGNPAVLGGLTREGLWWALTTFHAANWHPLTWLSHMLDVELFGPAPGGHHLVSALLHLLNALVLFGTLRAATGALWRSAFAAALFAVHPLHVESVAWVAERKDVLSALFGLLALRAYVAYARRPGPGRYLLVAAPFALGLAAKPMLVTLPLLLLLLDLWPLGRRRTAALVIEKLPLFALSLASSLVTLAAQSAGGAVESLAAVPLPARIANALVAYAAYLGKTFWPAKLAFFYPYPAGAGAILAAKAAGALLLLAAGGALAWRRRAFEPWIAVGGLWFLATLLPVIGLVQVGNQQLADRYTYLPLAGPFVAAAWAAPTLARRLGARPAAAAVAGAAAVVLLAGLARVQAGSWRDSATLVRHALAVTEGNWLAASVLGTALADEGRLAEAIPRYEEALRVNPLHARTWQKLGIARARRRELPEAIRAYRAALALEPGYAEAWNNLCAALAESARPAEAVASCEEALRLRRDYPLARRNLELARRQLAGAAAPPAGPPAP